MHFNVAVKWRCKISQHFILFSYPFLFTFRASLKSIKSNTGCYKLGKKKRGTKGITVPTILSISKTSLSYEQWRRVKCFLYIFFKSPDIFGIYITKWYFLKKQKQTLYAYEKWIYSYQTRANILPLSKQAERNKKQFNFLYLI